MNYGMISAAGALELGDMLFGLITFIVLLLVVGKFAWKPVVAMMAARQDKITSDLDYADNSRDEAEKLLAQRKSELQSTQTDAVNIINTAKANGEAQSKKIVADAHAEATDLKSKAEADIAQAKQDALNGARDQVADLSVAIASKIIGKELSTSDQQALIDDYIKGLGD
ncbi:F0F1 ATP synthase subunit B [Lacticaseibacillus sharpeae]|uniref:ATP synthase subunit b n=1 Tax=Lacticaseibacillus sharpeae JCM 1186 = DSM 20505 TaxID=1291052 RepID=A0A0R1ZTJ0_9LACO|nr:F0F1 ATP synthase subunit B [Lacticaseibacillus sharpeae]KRM56532.1 ATP synthase subunit B [Lacticaseibacillus sharpeae JCM 1186 = DSM 20505]